MASIDHEVVIVGQQALADGSHRFKMEGGPYDGMVFRIYPPFKPIDLPPFGRFAASVYEPAPARRGSKWVYRFAAFSSD